MATAQQPQRVSAADFIRGFANWRLQAAREPVVVTHHGKDAHVLISLDDYRRLDGEAGDVAGTADRLQQSLAGLVESIRDGVILIDRQWRILAANPAACDMLERSCADLIGAPLTTAVPRIEGSFLAQHLVRLIDHRERFSGDVPDILRPRQWLRVDLVPAPVGGALILRDVSDALRVFFRKRRPSSAARRRRGTGRNRPRPDIGARSHRGSKRYAARYARRPCHRDPAGAFFGVAGRRSSRRFRRRTGRTVPLGSAGTTGISDRHARRRRDRVTLTITEVRGPYASDGAVVLVTRRPV